MWVLHAPSATVTGYSCDKKIIKNLRIWDIGSLWGMLKTSDEQGQMTSLINWILVARNALSHLSLSIYLYVSVSLYLFVSIVRGEIYNPLRTRLHANAIVLWSIVWTERDCGSIVGGNCGRVGEMKDTNVFVSPSCILVSWLAYFQSFVRKLHTWECWLEYLRLHGM